MWFFLFIFVKIYTMKKILFLLLLSVAGYSQTSTGQEQEFDYGIKNNSAQTVTTPPFIVTQGIDNTVGKIPSAYIEKTADKISTITDYSETSYPNEKAAHDALDLKLNISDLPTNLTLYPTTTASDIGGYVVMVTDIHDVRYDDPAVDVTTPTITTTAQLVSQRISDAGVLIGQPGVFNITTFGNIRRLSGTGTATFYFEVYHRDLAGIETLICTSGISAVVSLSTYVEFTASGIWDDGDFISTDRIVIKTYANRIPGNSDPVYQFQFGGTTPVRTLLPVPFSVVDAGYEIKTNKQNSLTADGTGIKYPTVDAVNTLKWIKSDESLSLAQRKGDVLYGILDQYTGEEMTLSKVTGDLTVDGIIYFQLGSEYFKRDFDRVNVKWFGAVGDGINDDTAEIQAAINYCQVPYEFSPYTKSDRPALLIAAGQYKITNTLTITNDFVLKGEGAQHSIILLETASTTVPAIFINMADSEYFIGGDIGGFGIDAGVGAAKGVGIKMRTGAVNSVINVSSFHNIYIRNVTRGLDLDGVIYMCDFSNITITGGVDEYGVYIPNTMGGQVIYNSFNDMEVTGVGDLAYAYYSNGASCHYKNLTCDGVSHFGGAYTTIDGFTCEGIVCSVPISTNVVYLNQIQAISNVGIINVPNSKCTVGINALATSTEIKNVRFPDSGAGNQPNTPVIWQSGGTGTLSNVRMDRTCVTNLETAMGDAELAGFVISDCNTITNRGSFSAYSPKFLGVPEVPTATPGTNTDQAASTNFVTTGLALKQNVLTNPITGTGSFYLAKFTGTNTIADSNMFNDGSTDGNFAFTNPSANIKRIDLGNASWSAGIQSNSGALELLYAGTSVGLGISDSGILAIPVTPTTSAGTYDFLTRDQSTGVVEKVLSSTIATIASPAFTGTPTAPTATAGTNTAQIATTAFVQTATGNYKKYVAMLTQTSTSAPTAKVLENTLGGTVVWAYTSTGVYTGTLTGVFTADKSPVILTSNNSGVTLTGGASASTNFVGIETKVNGTLTDGSMTDSFIEIRVYP